METTAKPKKWGNSIGIIIPRKIVDQQNITLKDELIVHIEKKNDAEKKRLLSEGYIEMRAESARVNKEFEKSDAKWPRK